jgi:Icc-related predicted phosphoesterase
MKKQPKQKQKKDDAAVTLGDMISKDLLNQLKDQQQELKAEEEKRKEAEEQKKREERRLKEKNKTFEQLLAESSMNWKEFK